MNEQQFGPRTVAAVVDVTEIKQRFIRDAGMRVTELGAVAPHLKINRDEQAVRGEEDDGIA